MKIEINILVNENEKKISRIWLWTLIISLFCDRFEKKLFFAYLLCICNGFLHFQYFVSYYNKMDGKTEYENERWKIYSKAVIYKEWSSSQAQEQTSQDC